MILRTAAFVALAGAAFAFEGDEIFDGSAVVAAARVSSGIVEMAAGARYPRVLELNLPYKSSNLRLLLEANTALFSSGWFAAEWNDEGELINRTDNAEDYMCHYLGSVEGMPDAFVALSVCDDIGIQGRIFSAESALDLGVRATDTSLRSVSNIGEHTIYNMTALMDDISTIGDAVGPEGSSPTTAGRQNDPTVENARSRYVNNAMFVSSRMRIDQFSSSNQERSNTQSEVNVALSYYRSSNSRWNGDPPTHAIRAQEQNPSGYDQSFNPNRTNDSWIKCKDYRLARHGGTDNTHCLRVARSGERLGEANGPPTGCMCNNGCAAWSSPSTQAGSPLGLGYVIAHEMGHNYGFDHENTGVMGSQVGYFGQNAVNRWSQTRDNMRCLR